jgi:hypothetical protein
MDCFSGCSPAVGIDAAVNLLDFGTSRWQLLIENVYTHAAPLERGL